MQCAASMGVHVSRTAGIFCLISCLRTCFRLHVNLLLCCGAAVACAGQWSDVLVTCVCVWLEQVEYVDYGNREPVCKDHLRVLDAEFMADPVHCYCCRLHDVVPVT